VTVRANLLLGIGLGAATGLVSAAAWRAGMAVTALEGGWELAASALFVITLPAGALAALVGRLSAPLGPMTAFLATALTWMLLCVPYTVMVAHAIRRWRPVSIPTR
jgi:pilus assembly protein TadC